MGSAPLTGEAPSIKLLAFNRVMLEYGVKIERL